MSQSGSIRVEQILKDVGLFDEVNNKHELLSGIVKVVRSQGTMDNDTIIYRLAMTIYHAKRITNTPVIAQLEDAGAIYLRAINSPRLQALITEMTNRYRAVPIVELVKTFMCFLIAAYITEIAS